MKKNIKISFIFYILFTLLLIPSKQAFGYFTQDDVPKNFELVTEVVKKRKPSGKPGPKPNPKIKPKKSLYRKIIKPRPTPNGKKTEVADVGFTIWKLKTTTNIDGAKGVEEDPTSNTQPSKKTYQRLNSETILAVGEKIQISIESLSRDGYLYIIERELYSDGTYSDPTIMHPIRGKKNYVTPGLLTSTGVFNIVPSKSKKQQVAEVFTIIIAPTPLISPKLLQGGVIKLEPAKFNEWEKKWKVDVMVMEQEDGDGQLMTDEEDKGIEENLELTQDDPAPQTTFRANIKPGDPILTNVKLKFKSSPK